MIDCLKIYVEIVLQLGFITYERAISGSTSIVGVSTNAANFISVSNYLNLKSHFEKALAMRDSTFRIVRVEFRENALFLQ